MIGDLKQPLRLGIVIPLANEEDSLAALLDRIRPTLDADDRVFCVLDRMSRDKTRLLLAEYGRERDERFLEVWAPENRCVVDAYFRGYREAFSRGCGWILEMDGGLSHRPEEIPQFLEGMAAGYDYVGGSRFMRGGSHRSPLTRRILSRGGTLLARWLLGSQMTDMTSGFECFNRRAMEAVLRAGVRSRANFFQTEIRHTMHQFRWKEVPISYSNDRALVGRSSIRESFQVLFQLWREQRSKR